ncbi:MAG: hypothetical protein IKW87_10045 [Ruminococcus sp.]|nr:hypothetical protein [Ruminococcus sp.]
MKKIIEKILKNKVLRILIPLVLILAIIALVLQLTFKGGSKTSEWENYFDGSDYPVTASEKDGELHIKLDGSKTPDLSWDITNSNDELITVERVGKEEKDKLELAVKPKASGFTKINCQRSGTVAELPYTAVSIDVAVLITEDDSGKLTASLSDIYQTTGDAGALDSDAPFLIDGMRIVFPNGGSWQIYPEDEKTMPEGLYDVVFTVNDAGYECAFIMYNEPEYAFADEELMDRIKASRLVLKNDDIGYEKRIKCVVKEDGSMGIKVEDK